MNDELEVKFTPLATEIIDFISLFAIVDAAYASNWGTHFFNDSFQASTGAPKKFDKKQSPLRWCIIFV
jgi:hypothetical protein